MYIDSVYSSVLTIVPPVAQIEVPQLDAPRAVISDPPAEIEEPDHSSAMCPQKYGFSVAGLVIYYVTPKKLSFNKIIISLYLFT